MTSSLTRLTRRSLLAATFTATVFAASACGGSSSASSEAGEGGLTEVTVALSWTPNTDYTGVFAADELGYYEDQGIKLKVIPYSSTAPETLVAHGQADFGFSYQAGVTYARAAGQDVVAVYAPNRKGTYAISVSADRDDIQSPKDLDGKTYAGFGSPDEGPLLKYVIQHDGGKGDFKSIALDTSAYQAVYSKKADFTIPVVTWEGVEAERSGKPLKNFAPTDYGFPDQYSVLLASGQKYLDANPEVTKKFLAATAKGYSYAADEPDKAADLLVQANKAQLSDAELVRASQNLLASEGYLNTEAGHVGVQDEEFWKNYGSFLYENGRLTDSDGKALTAEPDWTTYYSNDYLASGN
ncbi:ABC transporter substrate-binding protein [Kineosporia rhizophila]|uniref:ABC transporter substrate-binding protein n=1 Tax=Kineosporia rhizophila TaxID=84633 RepID=UPI001E28933E|nr:ABC transporter substrate-binding protein [Kineosporia rhizophila]MCE0535253.1 ABC transporter substrate-binding protein [Kineosporia rhizophila]